MMSDTKKDNKKRITFSLNRAKENIQKSLEEEAVIQDVKLSVTEIITENITYIDDMIEKHQFSYSTETAYEKISRIVFDGKVAPTTIATTLNRVRKKLGRAAPLSRKQKNLGRAYGFLLQQQNGQSYYSATPESDINPVMKANSPNQQKDMRLYKGHNSFHFKGIHLTEEVLYKQNSPEIENLFVSSDFLNLPLKEVRGIFRVNDDDVNNDELFTKIYQFSNVKDAFGKNLPRGIPLAKDLKKLYISFLTKKTEEEKQKATRN